MLVDIVSLISNHWQFSRRSMVRASMWDQYRGRLCRRPWIASPEATLNTHSDQSHSAAGRALPFIFLKSSHKNLTLSRECGACNIYPYIYCNTVHELRVRVCIRLSSRRIEMCNTPVSNKLAQGQWLLSVPAKTMCFAVKINELITGPPAYWW